MSKYQNFFLLRTLKYQNNQIVCHKSPFKFFSFTKKFSKGRIVYVPDGCRRCVVEGDLELLNLYLRNTELQACTVMSGFMPCRELNLELCAGEQETLLVSSNPQASKWPWHKGKVIKAILAIKDGFRNVQMLPGIVLWTVTSAHRRLRQKAGESDPVLVARPHLKTKIKIRAWVLAQWVKC